jgi:ubiquinone/menaquinone biosynthesis C-methylase UbiE
MATVFMKWLETSPADYDRGIQLLTLGRLQSLKERIAADCVQPGQCVLEIGCGTGTLSLLMAERGARVTAIDASLGMLAEAKRKAAESGLTEMIEFQHLDVTELTDHFEPDSFDLIVSTLAFSEFPPEVQRYALREASQLLKPTGQLLIADEMVPAGFWPRFVFWAVRLPLVILTWLLTRTTTTPLHRFSQTLTETGFSPVVVESQLGGSLQLVSACPLTASESASTTAQIHPHLRHRVTLKTLLLDVLSVFRIIPPYPKTATGLYQVGQPDETSPVLVTGNYELTVRRLVRELDGKVDCWLLVADSAGINVWCAAGGGYFTAEKVIAAIKSSELNRVVRHHALILPQLCANGVDGWKIRQETGWGVHWGPARARDLPAYLSARRKKTDAMRWVQFPLKDRLEMVTVTLGFYGLLILLPILIFWPHLFWPVTAALGGLSYFYAILLPWLPGRDGLQKSIPLTLIALAGLFIYTALWNPLPPHRLFNWTLAIGGLAFFTAAELQGMSPLMRGEQANWTWEGIIGVALLLLYWLAPLPLGWR